MIALVIGGVFVPTVMWVVFLALYFAIWVTCLVALFRHRRHRPAQRERTVALKQLTGPFNLTPWVTSHKQLDNMMVMMVVVNSIMLLKMIFLTVSFVMVLLYFITPLYYVFCVLEDLAFVVILANPNAVTFFEPSRHRPEARDGTQSLDYNSQLPPQPSYNPQATLPQPEYTATMGTESTPYDYAMVPPSTVNHEAITIPASNAHELSSTMGTTAHGSRL